MHSSECFHYVLLFSIYLHCFKSNLQFNLRVGHWRHRQPVIICALIDRKWNRRTVKVFVFRSWVRFASCCTDVSDFHSKGLQNYWHRVADVAGFGKCLGSSSGHTLELVVQFPARGSTQVLLCPFPGVLWLWHFLYSVSQHSVSSLHIYTFVVSRAFMAVAASQAVDTDSSRAPGLTSGLQGSVNVHRGALLLVPQWQCIISIVFYTLNFCPNLVLSRFKNMFQ